MATPQDIYVGISIGLSITSVIGVYISPYINYVIQKDREARDAHKIEIRKHVLRPLVRGVNSFWQLYLHIDTYYGPTYPEIDDNLKTQYAFGTSHKIVESIPLSISVNDLDRVQSDKWFDQSMYNDLKNHYPDLFKKIEDTDKFVSDSVGKLIFDRWSLTNELHKEIGHLLKDNKTINDQKNAENIAVTCAFFELLGYPKTAFPGLFGQLEKLGIVSDVDSIVGTINFRQEGGKLANDYNTIKGRLFDELVPSLERANISGKKLTGNCFYLGE